MTIILDVETVRLAVERYLAQCVLRDDAPRRVASVAQEWDGNADANVYRVQLAPALAPVQLEQLADDDQPTYPLGYTGPGQGHL